MLVVSPLNEETLEKMRACTKAEFPICLDKALCRMFGAHGRHTLDSILKKDKFEKNAINSPKDIWKLYERYIVGLANRLGSDVSHVIEFESLSQMESMLCTKCPLYEMELEKLKISAKS